MRTLSLNFRQALYAENSSLVPIILMTLTHPNYPSPARFSTDPTQLATLEPLRYKTVSRGVDFMFVPMVMTWPHDVQGAAPVSRAMISNVNLDLIRVIRSVHTPPKMLMELVVSNALDTVEITQPAFDVVSAAYNADTITLEMTVNRLNKEPYPARKFTPDAFPSLF